MLRRQYLRFSLTKKIFAHKPEYRSDSENGEYEAAVIRALKNQKSFDNFKRSYAYRKILEHVSENDGQKYLKVVLG